jgi:hypothetical protein
MDTFVSNLQNPWTKGKCQVLRGKAKRPGKVFMGLTWSEDDRLRKAMLYYCVEKEDEKQTSPATPTTPF